VDWYRYSKSEIANSAESKIRRLFYFKMTAKKLIGFSARNSHEISILLIVLMKDQKKVLR